MQANEYAVLQRAIEEGIQAGWRRAHKHADDPHEETIFDQIENAIMCNIAEMFFFPTPFEEDDDDDFDPPKGTRIGCN